jgi:hypothetical protein
VIAESGGGVGPAVFPMGEERRMREIANGERDLYVTLSERIGELHDEDGQDAARH